MAIPFLYVDRGAGGGGHIARAGVPLRPGGKHKSSRERQGMYRALVRRFAALIVMFSLLEVVPQQNIARQPAWVGSLCIQEHRIEASAYRFGRALACESRTI